jgi:hypothetical protein
LREKLKRTVAQASASRSMTNEGTNPAFSIPNPRPPAPANSSMEFIASFKLTVLQFRGKKYFSRSLTLWYNSHPLFYIAILTIISFRGDYHHGFRGIHGQEIRRFSSVQSVKSVVVFPWLQLSAPRPLRLCASQAHPFRICFPSNTW